MRRIALHQYYRKQNLIILYFCTLDRFIVRDFVYDPRAIAAERNEKGKLEMQLKKQFVSFCSVLCQWLDCSG